MSIVSIGFLVLVVVSFGGFAISLFAVYLYTEAWKEVPSAPAANPLIQASQAAVAVVESLPRAA